MRSALFVAGSIVWVVACTTDAHIPRTTDIRDPGLPGRASYARDSAGVEILEFPLAVKNLPLVLTIDSIPLLDLGGRRDDTLHNLGQPEDDQYALQLAGPRYLVKDHNSLKLFDSKNQHVVTIGAAGTGRGEFQELTGVCVTDGDTVLALETNRVSVFTIDGRFVRSSPPLSGVLEPRGCFRDGSLLLITQQRRDSTAIAHFAANARRIRSDGSDVRILGAVQAGTSSPTIFMRANNVAFRDLLVSGDGRKAEIRIFRINGRLRRVIRWNESTTPVSPEVLRQFATNTVDAGELEAHLERTFMTAHPNELPVYHELRVDEVGRIWMLDYPEILTDPQPPVAWTVFDSTGAPMGRVEQPYVAQATGQPAIVWIGNDQVLLRWIDEEGYVHLTYHRLRD
jgi:hypothetical protein